MHNVMENSLQQRYNKGGFTRQHVCGENLRNNTSDIITMMIFSLCCYITKNRLIRHQPVLHPQNNTQVRHFKCMNFKGGEKNNNLRGFNSTYFEFIFILITDPYIIILYGGENIFIFGLKENKMRVNVRCYCLFLFHVTSFLSVLYMIIFIL